MKRQLWYFVCILCLVAVVAASPAQTQTALLITEVYYDTPGVDGEEEWIELANVGATPIDLSDYKVGDEETAGGGEGMLRFPAGAVIVPGQVIVVAQTAVGFQALFGQPPDYEQVPTEAAVPDMRPYTLWAEGAVALANDGDEVLLLDGQDEVVDAVNYGASLTYFAPAVTAVFSGHSIARVPSACDTDSAADWQGQRQPTPGQIEGEGACAVVDEIDSAALLPIGQIQGEGDVSPYVNQMVTFAGVVTGLYEDRNANGLTFYTLFVQNTAEQADGDPATSDGIAVFLGQERPSWQRGDQVEVMGVVTEFFGLTEIDDAGLGITLVASDGPLPAPIAIDPPAALAAQGDYFEAVESMVVSVDGPAQVIGPTINTCSFAVVTAGGERVFQRTAEEGNGQVVPVLHTSDVDCGDFPQVKSGDRVAGLAGPLTYHFDQFKIVLQQTADLSITESPLAPLPSPPALTADQFSIVTFNLENHFDTLDDTGDEAEPKPTAADLQHKQEKLAYAITQHLGCPTLIGVQEVEKAALLQELAAAVVDACGFQYQVTHKESVDVRGIDVALLSDPGRVTVQEASLQQGCTLLDTGIVDDTARCPAGQEPLFSRPPLLVHITVDGQPMVIIVNHFKSKRGGEAETAPRRVAQAQHVLGLVEAQLAQDAQMPVVVMGDFNDYDLSPPLLLLTETHLTNVLTQVPESARYSFVFSGVSQLIDGILLSSSLMERVVMVQIMHLNADYPDVWGWAADAAKRPYRATDHDIPLLVLTGARVGEPTPEALTPQPTALPAPSPTPESAGAETGSFPWWGWGAGGVVGLTTVLWVWKRRYRT